MKEKHTFVICAYGESSYLESCILSLVRQKLPSKIIMASSTPNSKIQGLAAKYQIPLFINRGDHGIVQDWNFAYALAQTEYVTIAHQDDIYHKEYTSILVERMEESSRPLIFFSDYGEIREGKIVISNTLLNIKKLMLLPLRIKEFSSSRFVRRRILSLGSPICCPSVGFAAMNLKAPVFEVGFDSNEDWEAWEKISRERGDFIYCNKRLVYHRIHEESATSRIIGERGRKEEDIKMFCKFWPKPVAKFLASIYGSSEKSNSMQQEHL